MSQFVLSNLHSRFSSGIIDKFDDNVLLLFFYFDVKNIGNASKVTTRPRERRDLFENQIRSETRYVKKREWERAKKGANLLVFFYVSIFLSSFAVVFRLMNYLRCDLHDAKSSEGGKQNLQIAKCHHDRKTCKLNTQRTTITMRSFASST